MVRHPAISVLMPVHNGEPFVAQAMESVLEQGFGDFELIVVDDGSQDATAALLADYAARDERVRVVRQPVAEGLTRSLNRSLALARGDLIARMDADDVCLPNRFEQQVEQLMRQPHLAAIGAAVEFIDHDGVRTGAWHPPVSRPEVLWQLIGGSPIPHPAAMIRRAWLHRLGGYDEAYRYAQDYDLWRRIVQHGGQLSNVRKALLRYRAHPAQASQSRRRAQAASAAAIARRYLQWLVNHPLDDRAAEALRTVLTHGTLAAEPWDGRQLAVLVRQVLAGLQREMPGVDLSEQRRRARKRVLRAVRRNCWRTPTQSARLALDYLEARPPQE